MSGDKKTAGPGEPAQAAPPIRRPGPRPISAPAVHRALGETSRSAIMALLAERPDGIDTAAMAAATGLHPNTVRHHLDVLVAAGLIRARPDPTRTGGRPRRLFQATRLTGELDAGEGYPLLAEIMVEELANSQGGAEQAAAAGRRWAQRHAGATSTPTGGGAAADVVYALIALFEEIGFQPELQPRPGIWQILLHHCPFLALARGHRDVVCGLHLGLIQGTLARHHVPLADGKLNPFVAPNLCIAALPRVAE